MITDVKKILVVDNQPLFRVGLRELVSGQAGWEVCGEIAFLEELEGALHRHSPHLILLDIAVEIEAALKRLKELEEQRIRVLVVSALDEKRHGVRALRNGALGYVSKCASPQVIALAMKRVMSGKQFISQNLSNFLANLAIQPESRSVEHAVETLSAREMEVFEFIGQGMGIRQIADQMGVSKATVNAFRSRIKVKLRITRGPALVHCAIRWVENRNL